MQSSPCVADNGADSATPTPSSTDLNINAAIADHEMSATLRVTSEST